MNFQTKDHCIASPGFNRWLVPPAALAIHLCIGMAYGYSVFWIPLSQSIGITRSISCPADVSWWQILYRSDCDWPIQMLSWIYTLFFVFLGSAAAVWGGWIEKVGPRKAGLVSACCWCGGLLLSALGVRFHQLWLLWLGSGVIGGIGLGLGYISPISTLIKWFPDRRGMATGMAIMGFGGGAMIGSPLANMMMQFFADNHSTGVWETLTILALIYFLFMVGGALAYRIPPQGWKPYGYQDRTNKKLVTSGNVELKVAMRTNQFWLLWIVLCVNVTAGIGILGMASPLLQEIFGGKLIGLKTSLSELNVEQKQSIAAVASGFTGLLSLFNIIGRFLWSTLSDRIGRKATYLIFLSFGCILYCLIPTLGQSGKLFLFVAVFCLILSMYGGGFATIPAYLADLFGTKMVGAIHGRLLTAWSIAGVIGPVLVTSIREHKIGMGMPVSDVYFDTMYILGALLCVGLVANLLIRPVNSIHFMKDQQAVNTSSSQIPVLQNDTAEIPGQISLLEKWKLWFAWAVVGIPLLWGFSMTIKLASNLFN